MVIRQMVSLPRLSPRRYSVTDMLKPEMRIMQETGYVSRLCCIIRNNAFRFLERTFGDSQELVMFVTELTAGADTSWFIENFGCDAYYRHNKELLFNDVRRRLMAEIAAARKSASDL